MDGKLLNDLALFLSSSVAPYIIAFVVILAALLIKDMITSIANGLSFKLGSKFKEGDPVLLDNESAIIVKIGLLVSVFGVMKKNNQYCWRYVQNQKIGSLKLEKIINHNLPNEE